MKESEIYDALMRREPEALASLIDLHAPAVYHLVSHILAGVGTAQDVEECCSEAFCEIWQKIDHYQPERAVLRTWLLMHVKYAALDRRRNLLRHQRQPGNMEDDLWVDVGPTPEMALLASEERRQVLQALDHLPPLEKVLIYRRYYLRESVVQIATDLGLNRQATDNRLWRARKTLRQLLGAYFYQEVTGNEQK
ncbi:MAG: sigma-70 family RNA polymerase sigma factor [Bacillota bacterium]